MNRFDASVLWGTDNQAPPDSDQVNDLNSADAFESYSGIETNGGIESNSGIEKISQELNQNDFSGLNHSDGTTDADGDEGTQAGSQSWVSASAAQTFFVPMHYEENYEYPLVVWLHSDGFNENQVLHVIPHVSRRNYIATGIRGPKSADAAGHRFQWSQSSTAMNTAEEQVFRAVGEVAERYNVHRDRIVLAGYQTGGSMAIQIALRNPDSFAAVVCIGGAIQLPSFQKIDVPRLRQRRLPILWQHAMPNQKYDEAALVQQVNAADSIKARAEFRYYRTEDEMNTDVLSDTDRWIMEQVVASPSAATINHWNSSPTMFSDN